MTVSHALSYTNLQAKMNVDTSREQDREEELRLDAVFTSNSRLQQMNASMELKQGPGVYSLEEITRLMEEVGLKTRLNPSQMSAVVQAIQRPLSLIQGI
jgi:hypothetical protein